MFVTRLYFIGAVFFSFDYVKIFGIPAGSRFRGVDLLEHEGPADKSHPEAWR